MRADLDPLSFGFGDGVGIEGAESPNCTYIGSPGKLANSWQEALRETSEKRTSENNRINVGDFWWAWVDLNATTDLALIRGL